MTGRPYDIVVIGGGHAGIEAALAGARLGARTALVTHDVREIGRMPCNPAIGGLGKGHLVREIDVLGGEMGLAIDETGIQFRLLNRKKGPAVRSPRAQADKHAYQARMMQAVLDQEGLDTVAGDAAGLRMDKGSIAGVVLADGRVLDCRRAILCSGTFLRGLMHVGRDKTVGGREGAASAENLSGGLTALGFELRRLKTGTPPRLHRDSIDFSRLQAQPGDDPPVPFSLRTPAFAPDQVDCHLAHTHAGTHELIRAALDRSPLYGGQIEGRGPRYCPSIEDKVVRFADKDRHLLFLEPEGLQTEEVYVNGLSTSLPADVQEAVVRSVPGLERARILRYGYAVEYDSIPSWQVGADLQAKPVPGLYLAGQILGTSGYEEAAAQGLVAGVNAVWSLDRRPALAIGRDEAYIGVLVDDLVTKEIDEPYRMFTSRAEHRLQLRCDNAAGRLAGLARTIGLLPGRDLDLLEAGLAAADRLRRALGRITVVDRERGARVTAAEAVRYPEGSLERVGAQDGAGKEVSDILNKETGGLRAAGAPDHFIAEIWAMVENGIKYDGYISKHNKLLQHRAHLDFLDLPRDLDYRRMTALSHEAREKLDRIRPANLGQAGRIDGVRAGDLAVLTVYVRRLAAEGER